MRLLSLFLIINCGVAASSHASFSTIKLSERSDELVLVKSFINQSSYQVQDILFYLSDFGYLVSKADLRGVAIDFSKLSPIQHEKCGECYALNDIGEFNFNRDNLSGRFEIKPSVRLVEKGMVKQVADSVKLAREPAGWSNFFVNATAKDGTTESASFSIEGSQTLHRDFGSLEFRGESKWNKYNDESGFKLNTFAYNHFLSDDAYHLKIGKFYDHSVRDATSFIGVNIGHSDLERKKTHYYDSYEFDIQIDGPGTYTVYNGGAIVIQGSYHSDRLQIREIRESVQQGLVVEVIDRYGEKHVFEKFKGNAGARLSPFQSFFDLSLGFDEDSEEYGVGTDLELGLPLNSNLKFSGSAMLDSSSKINSYLSNYSNLGEFGLSYYFSRETFERQYEDQLVKDSQEWSKLEASYSAHLGKFGMLKARYNLLPEDNDFLWSTKYTTDFFIVNQQFFLDFDYVRNEGRDNELSIAAKSHFGGLFTNLTFTRNHESQVFLSATYTFSDGYSSGLLLGKHSQRLSASYDGGNKSLTSAIAKNDSGTSRSLSGRRSGRFGAATGNVVQNADDTVSTSFSASSALAWKGKYIDVLPSVSGGLGLIKADYDNPEHIEFVHGGNSYNLNGGYALVPVSGNSKTEIPLKFNVNGASPLSSMTASFSPQERFADTFIVREVPTKLLVSSDVITDEFGSLHIDGAAYPYLKDFGAYISGIPVGSYSVTYVSDSRNVKCTGGVINLKGGFQQLELLDVFEKCEPLGERVIGVLQSK